jgi:putative PIN family toxin of toxin-antitoxin system
MRVVLDTNVVVSGLLQAFGPSGQIVRLVAEGELQVCYDVRILAEYREVLLRPKFRFEPGRVEAFLQEVRTSGFAVAARPLALALPDSDDAAFVEVAVAAGASCLVTGNRRPFPDPLPAGVRLLSPRELIDELAGGPD